MDKPIVFTTSCGMRCVSIPTQTASEICGVMVGVGSRDENPTEEGLAHFIEHTIFKGTSRHRSGYIINCMERTGGELNAYTTKEETVVYSTFPAGNLRRAANLIAELMQDSQFPEHELDLEREVVLDEVASYRDTPSDAVFDDYDELIFAGNSLAHNILGCEQTVRNFTSAQCRAFLEKYYRSGNMVFFHAGPTPVERVAMTIERSFAGLRRGESNRREECPVTVGPFRRTVDNRGHQAHTVIGGRTAGYYSEDRIARMFMTNMLGGPSMNSLLNVALRERRGLVYSVDASGVAYSDCGLLTVYFGCDREDVKLCARLVETIIRRLADEGVADARLKQWKRQIAGHMYMGTDNKEQVALSAARSLMLTGSVADYETLAERINDVSASDIRRVAEGVFPLSSLTLM